jgi:hypothetical protein
MVVAFLHYFFDKDEGGTRQICERVLLAGVQITV